MPFFCVADPLCSLLYLILYIIGTYVLHLLTMYDSSRHFDKCTILNKTFATLIYRVLYALFNWTCSKCVSEFGLLVLPNFICYMYLEMALANKYYMLKIHF